MVHTGTGRFARDFVSMSSESVPHCIVYATAVYVHYRNAGATGLECHGCCEETYSPSTNDKTARGGSKCGSVRCMYCYR